MHVLYIVPRIARFCTYFLKHILEEDYDTPPLSLVLPKGHGEEHVKKVFSTAVIVNEDTHSTFVRGH